MCGIAGTFAFRQSAEEPRERELLAMREAMLTRGPDGAGLWFSRDGRVGLAHRRLAIIDLHSRAAQPMHSADGRFSIVFNGEVYNYRALRDELTRTRGTRFVTEGDTEVLLVLFEAHGAAMLHKLRGMFAFAIWDAQAQRLFVARDPYGIKPLYYAQENGRLHFASQVKALLTQPRLSQATDPAGLVGFQLMGSVPEPFTLYQEARALPAGHFLWVDANGVGAPTRYAHIADLLAGAATDRSASIREVVAEAVRESVRAHLVADVEVGVFLSAGIDSGSLLGLMRDSGQEKIRALTLGFEELKGAHSDEVPMAREIARRYGAEHHVEIVSAEDFHTSADAILKTMDQPSIDGVNSWFVNRAAHRLGLKVVLSGLGGDELLGGYSNFRLVPRIRRVAGTAARLPFASRLARTIIGRFAPAWAERNPKLLGILDYANSWAGTYMLRRAVLLPFELDRRLDPETVRQGLERLRPLNLIGEAIHPDPSSDIGRVCALESSLYMRNQLLRDSDWASMAHSVELRVPFVDWPTLQRVAPVTPRLTGGLGKRALAEAASLPLPRKTIRRSRSGFTIPVANWIGVTAGTNNRLGSRQWSGRVAEAFDML
jgi:asparagine synthase (glutamine-hydrolysing)